MGPIWGQQDPDGPHVGLMNFAICGVLWWVCRWTIGCISWLVDRNMTTLLQRFLLFSLFPSPWLNQYWQALAPLRGYLRLSWWHVIKFIRYSKTIVVQTGITHLRMKLNYLIALCIMSQCQHILRIKLNYLCGTILVMLTIKNLKFGSYYLTVYITV